MRYAAPSATVLPAPSGPEPARPEGRELEATLLRAAQAGDRAAFGRVFEIHRQPLLAAARRKVADAHDAEDLVQEGFLRAWCSLHRYDPKYPFWTWVNRIVANLCIDHLRKRQLRIVAPLDPDLEEPRASHGPAQKLEAQDLSHRLATVFARMPARFRDLLILRHVRGLSIKEISRLVSRTAETTRVNLHKARLFFARRWAASEPRHSRASASSPVPVPVPIRARDDRPPSS